MSKPSREERIHRVIEHMVGRPKPTSFLDPSPMYSIPMDTPAKHDTYKEFEAARARNEATRKAISKFFGLLRKMSETEKTHFTRFASRWAMEEFGLTDTRC